MVYKALARECSKGNMQAIKLYTDIVLKTQPEVTEKSDISQLYSALEKE